jgi:hypothetical protein
MLLSRTKFNRERSTDPRVLSLKESTPIHFDIIAVNLDQK